MDNSEGNKPKLPIRYKQGANYRIYYADGALGSWSPRSNLSIDFYIDRPPIPEVVIHEIEGDQLGKVVDQVGDKGLNRERQFGLILSVQTAVELRDWLTKKIEEGQKSGVFEIKKENK